MKINVYGTESYCVWICREPLEIETDNYPELEGMSEDEIKEYIRENASDMDPVDGDSYSDLKEELTYCDIRREKTYNEESDIIFDNY
jgi:hypothetical protein